MKRRGPFIEVPPERSAEAGFTLIEILVTVVIITVIAAMALPSIRDGMKNRRTRHTAEEIARVFRDARLRAIGRGSAVLVHYVDENRSFEVREAVAGPPPNPNAFCNRLPATSCVQADWLNGASTTFGSEPVETYHFDEKTEVTGMKVFLGLPGTLDSQVTEFSVCFTPLGRTYAVSGPPTFTSTSVMNYAPIFRVWRTEPGDDKRLGLERRVVLLPNGQARLHSAGT